MSNPYADVLGRTPKVKKPKVRKPRPSPSHIRALRQEKETAKRLNGRVTPASGSRDTKGDVRVRGVARIECKTTKHKSFSVTLEMARKIEEAALASNEVPVLLVEFNDNGQKIAELAVIPAYLLDDFCRTKE